MSHGTGNPSRVGRGETYQAALRELREETGIEVAPECIEAPLAAVDRVRLSRHVLASARSRRARAPPLSLAALLPRFLSGESLEEELERWPGVG
jgi:8-oxo-dGTP pyrophosphatase MutT (NUDIX family)